MIGNLQVAARSTPQMKKSLIPHMRISAAAKASGMSTASIRFYEEHGLLNKAVRSDNGYRNYSEQDIDRLRQIRACRSLDMSLDEVQQLLSAPVDAPEGCKMTAGVLHQHLQHIEDRITELEILKNQMKELLALCNHDQNVACPTQSAMKNHASLGVHPGQSHLRHV
jgi:DNA-binding transcriptional MerR regulator